MPISPGAYYGHAPVTWDSRTCQRIIAGHNGLESTVGGHTGDGSIHTPTSHTHDDRYAGHLAGWNRTGAGAISGTTTSEARLIWTSANLIGGRIYECMLANITPDMGNPTAIEFHLRYSTSGAPNTGSPIMANSLRLSQFQLGSMRAYYAAGSNQTLYIGAFITSLDGGTVRAWSPGDGSILAIIDLGVTPAQTGGIP